MRRTIRRLMFVTDAPTFGGAERYILDMAWAARQRGIEPSVCWLPWTAAPEDLFESAADSRIPVIQSSPSGPRGRFDRIRRFREALRTIRPDALIVNASGRARFWQVCWQARAAGIPSVWVHHMVEQQDPRRIRPQWLGGTVEGPQWWRVPQALRHRLAAEGAGAVIVSNEADRDHVARWHGVSRPMITVIPPGVDCTRFRFNYIGRNFLREGWGAAESAENTPGSFVIGTAARLVERKGIEMLIEATALLRARGIPVTTVIAGEGPERQAFQALAGRRCVSDAVRFVGFIQDMPAFHSALDVFALCSETESFGLALAEAMACERPVVATPTAGARKQIRHLENGWQLSGFKADELTDALGVLYEALSLRAQLGAQARAVVESTFSVDRTLEQTLDLLSGEQRKRSAASAPCLNV